MRRRTDEREPGQEVSVLAGNSSRDNIVDVSVVEDAVRRGDAVRTHIRTITEATGDRLRIESI